MPSINYISFGWAQLTHAKGKGWSDAHFRFCACDRPTTCVCTAIDGFQLSISINEHIKKPNGKPNYGKKEWNGVFRMRPHVPEIDEYSMSCWSLHVAIHESANGNLNTQFPNANINGNCLYSTDWQLFVRSDSTRFSFFRSNFDDLWIIIMLFESCKMINTNFSSKILLQ